MTDAEAAAAIAARLLPGETLLWAEAAPANELASEAAGFAAFATIWAGFVVYALWRGIAGLRGVKMQKLADHGVFGGLAIGGLFLTVSVLILTLSWTAFIGAWHTAYGLTDQRVLVVRDFPFADTRSYGRAAFDDIEIDAEHATLHFDYGRAGKGGASYRQSLRQVEAPEHLLARIRATLHDQAPQP